MAERAGKKCGTTSGEGSPKSPTSDVPSESSYVSEVVWFGGCADFKPYSLLALKNIESEEGAYYGPSFNGNPSFVCRQWRTGWNSEVIGHSTIDAKDATEAQLKALYDEYDVKTGKRKEYVPKAGDVVEFEFEGQKLKAIVYMDKISGLSMIDNTNRVDGDGYFRSKKFWPSRLNKVGSVDMSGIDYCDKARKIAKQYFSTPTFTGTYAERQAQWVAHHKLKVGSKVKVVRKAESKEDGWPLDWHETQTDGLTEWPEHIIEKFHSNGIETDWCNPYFPYFVLEPVKS